MSQWITLDTARGPVRVWQAIPLTPARGAVIVVQEIFGANAHIRDVANRFAQAGYVALAPAMFDPVQPDVELRHDEAGMARGRDYAASLGFDGAVDIVRACTRRLREAGHEVAVVGFCWGGSVAFLSNTRLGLPAVSYYGARTVPFLHEAPCAPLLLHFGEDDPLIPPDDVSAHRRTLPQAALHVYPGAGHAFNRDVDHRHYHAASAALAWERTLAFLAAHLHG